MVFTLTPNILRVRAGFILPIHEQFHRVDTMHRTILLLSFLMISAPTEAEPTIFTQIYREKLSPIIYENEAFFCFFDAFPVNPGHALIVPKRQVPSIMDLTREEWALLQETLIQVTEVVQRTDLQKLYKNRELDSRTQIQTIEKFLKEKTSNDPNLTEENAPRRLTFHQRSLFHSQTATAKLEEVGVSWSSAQFNLGLNEGRYAGRTIDHLHFHIIPRFEGDMKNPVGGVRNIFPELGNYTIDREIKE